MKVTNQCVMLIQYGGEDSYKLSMDHAQKNRN